MDVDEALEQIDDALGQIDEALRQIQLRRMTPQQLLHHFTEELAARWGLARPGELRVLEGGQLGLKDSADLGEREDSGGEIRRP